MTRFNPDPRFDSTDLPTSPGFKDRTGQRFGRLVFEMFAGKRGQRCYWWVRCDCGTRFTAAQGDVAFGHTTSCGCVRSEKRVHGHSSRSHWSPEYRSWKNLKTRCFNPKCDRFKNYGGRGIKVCNRWLKFENFLADMGPRPSADHSIDRIDVNGDYEPANCRWATDAEQRNNQRPSKIIRENGRIVRRIVG